jgi:hypothetical protein
MRGTAPARLHLPMTQFESLIEHRTFVEFTDQHYRGVNHDAHPNDGDEE